MTQNASRSTKNLNTSLHPTLHDYILYCMRQASRLKFQLVKPAGTILPTPFHCFLLNLPIDSIYNNNS